MRQHFLGPSTNIAWGPGTGVLGVKGSKDMPEALQDSTASTRRYADAKFRSLNLGDFNYFYSYMSQPKSQLETFKAWAGKESDISYYLNSHHVDICEWMVRDAGWRPASVRASSLKWYNPFYMRYAPDEEGNFAGQGGYGYVSFVKFVDGVTAVNEGRVSLEELDKRAPPTLGNTVLTTAILEAGRRSLDEGGRSIEIVGEGDKIELK
ncbi:hypothetical protein LTS15_001881 [Exophiala xenobiotica]|nr:hypothetical protein LTS15_001881 [Exophiala xenobiotica]